MKRKLKDLIPPINGYYLYENGNIELSRSVKGELWNVLKGDVNHTKDTNKTKEIKYTDKEEKEGIEKSEETAKRGDVTEFSTKSRVRFAWTLTTSTVNFTHLCTLTYGENYPTDNITVKVHRERVIAVIRRLYAKENGKEWVNSKDVGYVWFTEFQARGAIHFHILLSHKIDQTKILRVWLKINEEMGNDTDKVKYVHTRTDKRGDSFIMQREKIKGGLKRYGVKYGLKMKQKNPPKWWKGRFYGYSKNVKNTDYIEYIECDEKSLRIALGDGRANKYEVLPRYILGAFDDS